MKNILQISKLWCSEISEKLKDNEDMILISGNKMRSLLLEGILKFSETCRFPVRGYEAEEFMHGMYNAVTSKTNFYIFFHLMVMKEIEWKNCSIIIQSRVTVYLGLIPNR